MINTRELRIGNLVNHSTRGVVEVLEVYTNRINIHAPELNMKQIGVEINRFEYVSLNEEWLVKFGLIKKYLENPFEEGGYDLDENGNRWYYWVKGLFNLEIQSNGEIWFEVYNHYIHVKYVHHLQNLYSALCNEELTINKEQ